MCGYDMFLENYSTGSVDGTHDDKTTQGGCELGDDHSAMNRPG